MQSVVKFAYGNFGGFWSRRLKKLKKVALVFLSLCCTASAQTFTDEDWMGFGGFPGAQGTVWSVVFNPTNDHVYVGGSFPLIGNSKASNIAMWDGVNWTNLAGGLNSTVYALALDKKGRLYAGGRFGQAGAGGPLVSRLAMWDGASWTNVGGGVNQDVFALAVDSNNHLYVGGR